MPNFMAGQPAYGLITNTFMRITLQGEKQKEKDTAGSEYTLRFIIHKNIIC